jgi:hypothetical protein
MVQPRCSQILKVEVIAEHRARGRADDDLVRLRQGLQAAPPGSASSPTTAVSDAVPSPI